VERKDNDLDAAARNTAGANASETFLVDSASGREPAAKATNGDTPVSAQWGATAPFLSALGTSVGLIGFVVFFGGAILWTQADAVGLPASEVVALVPRSVLLSTGAHFLVAALLLALLGVGVLWVYDTVLRDRLLRKQEEEERVSDAPRFALQQRLDKARQREKVAAEALNLAAKAQVGALQAAAGAPDSNVFSSAVEEAQTRRSPAEEEAAAAEDELKRVEQEHREMMPELQRQAEATQEKREHREIWTRLTALGIPLLILEVVLTTFASIAWYDYVALVALSAATIAVVLVIYAETERFLWFGISAFVAIGLYIGFAMYFRTHDSPRAEPAAALIDGRAPVDGYFIAQTSDRIYFGIPRRGLVPARLIALRREDVIALAIGRLTPIGRAFDAAQELGISLCADLSLGQSSGAEPAYSASRPRCPRDTANLLRPVSH
jgi:hypothetical protein